MANGLHALELLVGSAEFRSPRHEGKPYAMVYRTFINYLKHVDDLEYLREFEFKH